MSRLLAVCVVFFAFSAVLALLLLFSIPLIVQQVQTLVEKLPEWLTQLQNLLLPLLQSWFDLPEGALPVEQFKHTVTENWLGFGHFLTRLTQYIAGSGLVAFGVLANLVLIPVVSFYLLRDWDILVARIRDLLPRAWEPVAVSRLSECDEIIGAFIRGQFIVMLSLGAFYSLGLSIVGLDLAILLGTIAGLASIVPYLGFIVGIGATSIAAYFQFHDFWTLLLVVGVFGVGQMLESMFLTPLLVGDRIGLHPVAVIFAILAGGQLAGFTGVLLGLPVAAVIMVWLRHFHDHYKNSDLYHFTDEAVLSPESGTDASAELVVDVSVESGADNGLLVPSERDSSET